MKSAPSIAIPYREIFATFAALLDRRFVASVFTTEDSIRYTFFAALLDAGVQPEEVEIESPHPQRPRARIDTYIRARGDEPGAAFEFKYAKESEVFALPRPMIAGSLLHDLQRLADFKPDAALDRYFVFATGPAIHNYLRRESNGLACWYDTADAPIDLNDALLAPLSKTLRASAGSMHCHSRVVFAKELSGNHWLKIWQVITEPAAPSISPVGEVRIQGD